MGEPIAIVGSSCRFPGGASSPSKLWDLLKAPRDVVSDFDPDRLNFANFYHQNGEKHGRTNVRHRAYLLEEDVRHFDAPFFRINPQEAADMDPQHRILLETAYEAFEAAGWPLHSLEGSRTSVHVGVMTDDYYAIQARDVDTMGRNSATGLSRAILSNRVSYTFDLKGPSMTVDTACSGSLVALHLAVQALRTGEASQALVAGVNLLLDPYWFIAESTLHMLSPDSQSRMWDKDANGYARGEGCAAVLLKPLSKAIEDGDHIESIIRETGVNSDGKTNGVTMPDPVAQAELIRQTYYKAGLDPVSDRCQYFECHGTGTQAGDPVEARAVRDAFFPEGSDGAGDEVEPLYCGSIKTVIGHLEGGAGLAGLIKASLAIQNKVIPPNMHFHELNPSIKPFYDRLRIPTSTLPWPETHGQPRRASVNSFGFGGTNAHAILESFEPLPQASPENVRASSTPVGSFLLSARTTSSLASLVKEMLDYVSTHAELDLSALAYTLHSRRTAFRHRITIPMVTTRQQLIEHLQKEVNLAENLLAGAAFGTSAPDRSSTNSNRILGVFTGQGAQAAQMGLQLLESCPLFAESLQKCEDALASLPTPPDWSLQEELAAPEDATNISEARISQPLCTALQIALVDLLKSAGIGFSTVVGHSSGEIGAAYAAGLLNLHDAMGIAYYRGHVAHLATGCDGQAGGMIAASLSFADATAICSRRQFAGRIGVAASNAPSSVTLSGDADAITELKQYLAEKKIQARQLRVDTAYHSHHMLCCAETYLSHIRQLDVQIQKPPDDQSCVWISSVYSGINMLDKLSERGLSGEYWVDNMVRPVLFSEAISFAIQHSPHKFDVALEVGPHPALKGPVSQTIKALNGPLFPYSGCLERKKDAVEAVSAALGTLWTYLGPSSIDFRGWRKAFSSENQPVILKGLPSYAWDHEQIHWHESRVSRNFRLGTDVSNTLLGRLQENSGYERRWRNMFHLEEMPWVKGHTFQGQVLFPGAGYVTLAIDAAKDFVGGRAIKMVEIQDMEIPKPLVMSENSGVEVLFTIRSESLPQYVKEGFTLEAEFVSYACLDRKSLEKTCKGRMLIYLGQATTEDLPPSSITESELASLSTDRFHAAISEIGLVYEGPFRGLSSLSRSWGHAKAMGLWEKGALEIGCALHPAVLDVAFQTGLATVISNAERALESSYLPVGIRRVIIDPNENYQDSLGATKVNIESFMTSFNERQLEVDINVCTQPVGRACGIQVDGLILKAIAEPQPADDRNLFVKTVWDVDGAYGLIDSSEGRVYLDEPVSMVDVYERISLFYMNNLVQTLGRQALSSAKRHHKELLRYIDTTLETVQSGKHPVLKIDWLHDSIQTIRELSDRHPDNLDVTMLCKVGENLPSVVRQESDMMEHIMQDDLFSRFYRNSKGLLACNQYVCDLMRQISHKHPRANIIEIGAGTGGTTLDILDALGTAYSSYTCTDISEFFFGKLKDKLPATHHSKVQFKAFNVEKRPAEQDLEEKSFDVVIAANVLHATRNLSETVQNARALLRPGGYLIAVEVTGSTIRSTGIMGGLEGWWLGVDEGRRMGPCVSIKEWDDVLRRNEFSGIDCVFHDYVDASRQTYSAFSTQVIDSRYEVIRDPLTSIELISEVPIMILGGVTLKVSKLARRAERILRRWCADVKICEGLEDLDSASISPGTFLLSLSELDKPFFSEDPTTRKLDHLQEMLSSVRGLLLVTSGRLLEDPYPNMMVGVGRALSGELPHVDIHYLDLDPHEPWHIDTILSHFLRMVYTLSSQSITEGRLWVQEPETLIRGGKALIPRLIQDHAANETLNAKRRRITKPVGPEVEIGVVNDVVSSKPLVVSTPPASIPKGHVAINVRLSVPLHNGDESPCFLCVGTMQRLGTEKMESEVLAVVGAMSSTVVKSKNSLYQVPNSYKHDAKSLVILAHLLIGHYVNSKLSDCGTTLVSGVSEAMAATISALACQRQRNVLFINTTTTPEKERPGWIQLHPFATTREVQKNIPDDLMALVTFKNRVDKPLHQLTKYCDVHSFSSSQIMKHYTAKAISKVYQAHVKSLSRYKHISPSPKTISIHEVTQKLDKEAERMSYVLNWERTASVSAAIPSLQPESIFSSDKTYLLVGMAGELGQSLTNFMVRGGARHIVLSSRNPKNNQHWLAELRSMGADVRVVKMDVTDRAQVRQSVAMIRKTMPEIGGVANGALVLEAGIFVHLSAESMTKQLKPKVLGTINLDQEFENDDLEFFLTFGSLATVCGNPGQSMYHAGNLFMATLVEQRRQRGKAASILNFGLLVDIGYVARTDRSDGTNIEGILRSLLLTPLSEAEFHHVVMQGIVAGRPGSLSGEVIMGMEPYIDDGKAEYRPAWVDKSFFSHMIHAPTNSEGVTVEVAPSSMKSLHEDLVKATNISETTGAVMKLLTRKVKLMMKTSDIDIDSNAPLADLGLDSLHGIEIRRWLLDELLVSMPLLKILGREPFVSICGFVAQMYMSRKESQAKEQGNESEKQLNPGVSQDATTLEVSVDIESTEPRSNMLPKASSPQPAVVDPRYVPKSPGGSSSESPIGPDDEDSSEASDYELRLGSHDTGISPSSSDSSIFAAELELRNFEQFEPPLAYEREEPLSFAQAGIHFLHTFLEDPISFNVTTRYSIRGPLNVNRFSKALEKALLHHDACQTSYFANPGTSRVSQHLFHDTNLRRLTHIESTAKNADQDANAIFDAIAKRPYSLAAGETFRPVLVSHGPEWHTLVFGFHLVATDALGFSNLLHDVDRAYQLLPLPDSGSYLDFARQQHEAIKNDGFKEAIAYWKDQLSPLPTEIPLFPVAHVKQRKARRTYGNVLISKEMNGEFARKMRQVSQSYGATPMQFYLAAMQILVVRLAGIDDVCIGVTDNGRQSRNFEGSVGHFANILPVRFKVGANQSFKDLIQQTSNTMLKAFDNAQVPFDVLLEHLKVERSPECTPLFQLAFNYRLGDTMYRRMGDCTMSMDKYEDVKTPYDLTINVTQTADHGNLIECITSDYIYSPSATKFITDSFVHLIESIIRNQSVAVAQCKLFSDAQVEHAISLGKGPNVSYEWPHTLPERFWQVAGASPESVAIKDAHESMTYRQLSCKADSYSASLRNEGVGRGSRVAVFCEPSIDMYATMLAVIQIGAVYVPLDTKLPKARLQAIIDTCKPSVLTFHNLTVENVAECFGKLNMRKLNISTSSQTSDESRTYPFSPASGNQDSFILFTSGSTGTPKGIRLGQSGIMNYAAAKRELLGLGPIKVLQQTSPGFDMAIAQVFNAFANGGTLVIAPSAARGDPTMLANIIRDEGIEFTLATPSEYQMWASFGSEILQQCPAWRYICSGGEVVTDGLINSLKRLGLPALSLVDCYGPTEISCATTFHHIPLGMNAEILTSDEIAVDVTVRSVGKAIPNTSIYVVSEEGSLLPVGIPGEICVGGSGVANGYLDEEISSTKFVPDRFRNQALPSSKIGLMYKTGDKGLLQPDGSLSFLGRTEAGDTLVKLRGLRIDLTEVSNAILNTAPDNALSDAVVTVRGEPQYLVCHAVPAAGKQLDQSQLHSLLSSLTLPRHMIPSIISPLERLPTTPNGKVDRKALQALPLPEKPRTTQTQPGLTVPEGELQEVWLEVLGDVVNVADIGPTSDFFTVGGSSLLLVRLQNAIREKFGVALTLQELYQATTLREMAASMHKERRQLAQESIDWSKEIAIPGHILDGTGTALSSQTLRNEHLQVLLTGSTSFLGREILLQLLSDDNVAKVHCVAVPEGERHLLPSSYENKMTVYPGSILSRNLGLSGKEFDFLKAEIDQIFHASAQGHCMNNYSSVKQGLYLSTQSLAGLAIPRRIPFHLISAPRVALLTGQYEAGPVSLADHLPPTDGSQGVTSAKWASERFLENVALETGLPVAIHRPCALVGERAPANEVFNSVVKFSQLTRKVPNILTGQGFFDFKDASVVASEIAKEPPPAPGSVQFRHHSSNVRVLFSEVAERMKVMYGGDFEVVEAAEWLKAASLAGMDSLLAVHLGASMEQPIAFPYLGK